MAKLTASDKTDTDSRHTDEKESFLSLTWVCFVTNEDIVNKDTKGISKLIKNFSLQKRWSRSPASLTLLFLVECDDEEKQTAVVKCIETFAVSSGIQESIFYKVLDTIAVNESYLKLCVDNVTSTLLSVIHLRNRFEPSFSWKFVQHFDKMPNCDIAFSTYRTSVRDCELGGHAYEENLLVPLAEQAMDMPSSGVVWRKAIYYALFASGLSCETMFDEGDDHEKSDTSILNIFGKNNHVDNYDSNLLGFWSDCRKNSLNMMCVTNEPLYTIYI